MFSGFLQGLESRSLPAIDAVTEPEHDIAAETLERRLADQELGRFLVPADFAESDGTRAVPIRFALRVGRPRKQKPRSVPGSQSTRQVSPADRLTG